MPFQNQFALSLELTRVAPVGLIVSKAGQALMRLARDLQNSGSDIVIEEDLANIFGRCEISSILASSFKTVIAQSDGPPTLLDGGIALVSGAGPTVIRGLQESPYFATVVQTSLLMSVHERKSLANAIHETMERNQEGAPPDNIPRAPPTTNGILSVLRAIEEQTSAYDWSGHLLAVSEMLPRNIRHLAVQAIPQTVLTGALNMFPMVTSLPLDRLIYIEGSLGMCTIIVWAHHVLGLNVLVKTNEVPVKDIKFGVVREGEEQVIIDTHCKQFSTPCITLLDVCKEKEELFRMEVELGDPQLQSCFKVPAKGYGNFIMGDSSSNLGISDENLRASVVHDMSLVSTSFAFILAQHLMTNSERKMRWVVSNQSLLNSARFLFSDTLSEASIREYVIIYSCRPLDLMLAPPASVMSWIRTSEQPLKAVRASVEGDQNHKNEIWGSLVYVARTLSCLILALAHVRDLKACDNLPLTGNNFAENLGYAPFAMLLEDWKGTEDITVHEDTWLNIISLLMTGHRFGADSYDSFEDMAGNKPMPIFRDTCLVSDRGWSLYISTFGREDPFSIDRDMIQISKGVPCRNGVRKHEIIDGPSQKMSHETSDWILMNCAGEMARPSHASRVYFQPSMCGDREDTFVVTIRLADRVETHTLIRRTGYREFYSSLCNVIKTRHCEHPSHKTDKVLLSPGCSTVMGFGDGLERDGKMTICLTAGDRAARWRAIIATASYIPPNVRVCLRGRDCCYSCAIDQVAKEPGKWFLIF